MPESLRLGKDLCSKDGHGIQMWTGVQSTLSVAAWPLGGRSPSVPVVPGGYEG